MDTLLSAVWKGGESVRDYIERFHNISLMCPTCMPLPMLLPTCRHNFLDKVEVRMWAVKAHTWKELIKQAEIVEKLAKKFETPKSRWGINNKSYNTAETSDTSTLKVYGGTQSKKGNSNRTSEYQRQYFFKDKHVVTLFHLLSKGNKLKLPEARRPDEMGQTNDPNYCLFHKIVHHPTCRCNILKDKIQALIEAGVLTLKSEHKRGTA